jgi:hypothetical protein
MDQTHDKAGFCTLCRSRCGTLNRIENGRWSRFPPCRHIPRVVRRARKGAPLTKSHIAAAACRGRFVAHNPSPRRIPAGRKCPERSGILCPWSWTMRKFACSAKRYRYQMFRLLDDRKRPGTDKFSVSIYNIMSSCIIRTRRLGF